MKRLIDRRPGVTETFHMDDEGNVAFQITSDDLQPVVDSNHFERNHGNQGKDFRRVASIPVSVQYKWIQEFGVDPLRKENAALLKRLLNSNEYRYLRTSEIII